MYMTWHREAPRSGRGRAARFHANDDEALRAEMQARREVAGVCGHDGEKYLPSPPFYLTSVKLFAWIL